MIINYTGYYEFIPLQENCIASNKKNLSLLVQRLQVSK